MSPARCTCIPVRPWLPNVQYGADRAYRGYLPGRDLTCGRCGTRQTMAQAMRHVDRERRRDPQPSSHLARAGTGTLHRAESSITIEPAETSPSTVSGTSRPVQPTSPCARTRA